MNAYKILTWNCNGLNNPIKVRRISNLISKEKTHIVCLQETHYKKKVNNVLKSPLFCLAFQAPGSSKARGVAILIAKNFPFQEKEIKIDPSGRYILVKGKLEDKPLTIASIYSLNSDQLNFIKNTMEILSTFQDGEVIIGCDFNIIVDSLLDTSLRVQNLLNS